MKERVTFKVVGLDCSDKADLLRRTLEERPGIFHLKLVLLKGKVTIVFDPSKVGPAQILLWIKELGMETIPWLDRGKAEKQGKWKRCIRLTTNILSGVALCIALFLHLQDMKGAEPLCFIAILLGGYFALPKAYLAIKHMRPDMNLLIIVAIIGAIGVGKWYEGAAVAFLFSTAFSLEHWNMERARHVLSTLMDLSPAKAHVIGEGEREVERVEIGAHILVRPGEKVALDAIIERGSASINQASMTGESLPVIKVEGDEVYAGTINEEGTIECRVTKRAEDSAVARIIRLVKEAQSRRAPSQQWIEKFARIYTPIMMGLALLIMGIPPLIYSGGWEEWFYRGLVTLMIACPCALVLSTPVSIVAALSAAARNGVLIKGGIFLERMSKLRALALDKTGTLTYGRPEVQCIFPCNKHTERELLECAASLEAASKHPLAYAILKVAEERDIPIQHAKGVRIIKGKGAEGLFRGKWYWIGSHRLMHEMQQESSKIHQMALNLEDAGHSLVAIGNREHVCGLISIADKLLENIAATVQEMKDVGVERVIMLTGDNRQTAKAIAECAGIEEIRAELLPEDKLLIVKELMDRWGGVAMVGDGVNDAPAMAGASVGIAMGMMGNNAAIETADITLMSDDLSKVPWLVRHSRRTLRTIKQNVGFSLTLKVILLGLAIVGLTSLWMAIVVDTGTALFVVPHALRLIRRR